MNIDQILPYFDNWKKSGTGRYMASCPMPAHSDSDPSVSITQDVDTGKILMYCWGCNTKGFELVQAMGLRTSDLFGDPGHPSAIKQSAETEVSDRDLLDLSTYVSKTHDNLPLAKEYILNRFGLSESDGHQLRLGVDPGDNSIIRPEGYEAFNSGVPHLIIPFLNPQQDPIGMQGRRLIEGEPRWRSKSGSGWSKIGCFGWELSGPVIITEGPSDALAVVGRAKLPALAVRGASITDENVCVRIKEWLGNRPAVVIGDHGEAGEKFSRGISEGVGVPTWELPEGYSDVCDFLEEGYSLDAATQVAGLCTVIEPEKTAEQVSDELVTLLISELDRAVYNEELKDELRLLPSWQLDDILNRVVFEAGHGQVGNTRRRIENLRRALRDGAERPPVGGGGGARLGDNIEGLDLGDLPEILWNSEDQLVITEFAIKEAMNNYEGRDFYQAAPGQYVKVVEEDLVNLKEAGVKSMLSQVGHWRVVNGQRELGHVPQEAAKMVTDPSWDCGIPIIKRRVDVPFMLQEGNIISTQGYHEESGIYLLPRPSDRILVPEVPSIITEEHIAQARKIFNEVVEGFVFKDEASKANLVAMTLTSPLRELFKENPMVPLLTSTAPQSGSGKGTSVRVPLSTCGVGPYSLSTTAYNSDENEFEKKLVGKLLKKSTYIFLDNIRAQVSSSVLEQMLTAANYDGRTLGYSEVNRLSTLVLWVCTLQSTGTFNRDLTRRCVPVELIKNYKGVWAHKNIDSYLADMRGQMIWACFVAARKWMQDGSPISHARLDGYGGWTEVIGGILEHVLGFEGFLTNLDSFRDQQDAVAMTVDGLLERWLTLYGEDEHPARMAVEDYEDPALHQLLGLHNPTPRQVMNALDRQLTSQRGHIIADTHIFEPVGTKNYGHEGPRKLYRCVPLNTEE